MHFGYSFKGWVSKGQVLLSSECCFSCVGGKVDVILR